MNARVVKGAEIDTCSTCKAIFLDAGEADITGIDTAKFFGLKARPAGPSARMCPCGGAAMTRFQIDLGGSSIEIDRASCCGGVFLDAGEHEALMGTGGAPAGTQQDTGRHCPRCSTKYEAFVDNGIEVDSCSGCGSLFLDLADTQAMRVDTASLFGVGPELARDAGPSELKCPEHGVPMVVFQVKMLSGLLEIDRATCCGGVFLDGGEQSAFVRATRRATTLWADQKFAAGESVAKPEAIQEARAANALIGLKAVVESTVEAARQRAAHRRYQDHYDDDW